MGIDLVLLFLPYRKAPKYTIGQLSKFLSLENSDHQWWYTVRSIAREAMGSEV